MEIIRDNRIGNAILRRMAKSMLCEGEVYMDSRFHYIEFTCTDDITLISFARIEYKGCWYEARYFDGCFNPYLVRMC